MFSSAERFDLSSFLPKSTITSTRKGTLVQRTFLPLVPARVDITISFPFFSSPQSFHQHHININNSISSLINCYTLSSTSLSKSHHISIRHTTSSHTPKSFSMASARRTTTHILMSFHTLLLASLLFGTIANAAVLNGSPGLTQVKDISNISPDLNHGPVVHGHANKRSPGSILPLYHIEPYSFTIDVPSPSNDYGVSDDFIEGVSAGFNAGYDVASEDDGKEDLIVLPDKNLNHGPVITRKVPTSNHDPTGPSHPHCANSDCGRGRKVITRQILPSFHCPAAPTCNDPKACLYADPNRCSGFIQCDVNGVAWLGYCPMESMIWNSEKNICDYAKEKGNPCAITMQKDGENKDAKDVAVVPHISPVMNLTHGPSKSDASKDGTRSAAPALEAGSYWVFGFVLFQLFF